MMKITASLMCADPLNLGDEIRNLQESGTDWFHFDIMDGSFVPNFALGTWHLKSIRKASSIPIDIHLMTVNPMKHIKNIAQWGADIIIFHIESSPSPSEVINEILSCGKEAGIALNPETSIETVKPYMKNLRVVMFMMNSPGFPGQKFNPSIIPRITKISKFIAENDFNAEIMVDGAISVETIPILSEAGATIFVGGTSGLFGKGKSYRECIENMKKAGK